MRTSTNLPLLVTILVLFASYAAASFELTSEMKTLNAVPRNRRFLRANTGEKVESAETHNEERGVTAKVGTLIKDWKIKQMFKNGKSFEEIFNKGITSGDVWHAFKISKLQNKMSLRELQFNPKYAKWFYYDDWYAWRTAK
ncbi:hypothetical protein P3T76_006049 [Phytophthora citrophthora]|uniref:RxLR effector protein n=1 Tax=Phytophthora citrophthora TaxID=4793 RepID=A0AAD9GPV0_9STRA|nr:hypothetical protein P3T76_006049 [Phytophthora citrophthora]